MRTRWITIPFAALVLGSMACNPAAVTVPPVEAATATTAAPIATTQLPPAPVPSSFDVAGLADKVKPTVVNITITQKVTVAGGDGMDPFDFFFGGRNPHGGHERSVRRQAVGTGFIIDPSGYVVTNEHVVRDADDVRVHLADERELKAEVVGRDPRLDVALLKIKGAGNLPAAPMGSSERLRVGEHVLAVGNPFGLGHTVTLGIVSAKARTIGAGPYDDFIQTDASINPGNSGGPLFNWRGEVVGINTAIRAGANGIGFAIPIDEVGAVLGQLREKGKVERGRLGLGYQTVSADLAAALGLPSPRGAIVSAIEPGGAALRAGIRPGDVILAVNGIPIAHAEELPRRVAHNPPGSTVDLTLMRDGKKQEIKAVLDALPDDPTPTSGRPGLPGAPRPSSSKLGIQVSDAPGGGVRVDDVDGDQVRDLSPGDVIVELAGTPVKDTASLRAAMNKVKPGTTALLKVRRGKLVQYAAVPVPASP